MPKMEMPEKHKVEIEGAELVTIKGEKGDKGDVGETGPQGESIVGPEGKMGLKGDTGEQGERGETPDIMPIIADVTKNVNDLLTPLIPKKEDIENDIIKSGEKIRDSLELLEGDERLDKKAIKGLEDFEKDITALKARPMGGGGGRRVFQPKRDDLSSLTDGSTKIFYLSKAPIEDNVIMVFGTDFPTILRPTIDFTIANKTLTLTDAIPAPSQGATLIVTYFT